MLLFLCLGTYACDELVVGTSQHEGRVRFGVQLYQSSDSTAAPKIPDVNAFLAIDEFTVYVNEVVIRSKQLGSFKFMLPDSVSVAEGNSLEKNVAEKIIPAGSYQNLSVTLNIPGQAKPAQKNSQHSLTNSGDLNRDFKEENRNKVFLKNGRESGRMDQIQQGNNSIASESESSSSNYRQNHSKSNTPHSIVVKGRFKGNNFQFEVDSDIELLFDFAGGLAISADTDKLTVLNLMFEYSSWFRSAAGDSYLDPADPANRDQIIQNIKDSITLNRIQGNRSTLEDEDDSNGEGGDENEDEGIPLFDIEDAKAGESDSLIVFTARISTAINYPVTVYYSTADSTASKETDYFQATDSLRFEPGESEKQISIVLKNDDFKEEDPEAFILQITDVKNAELHKGTAAGTIIDDDGNTVLDSTVVNIADIIVGEGENVMNFTVSLDSASSRTVEVDYATAKGSASVAGGDYLAASGTLIFAPGDTIRTVPVSLVENVVNEATETMKLQLSNARNAVIGTAEAEASITDNDLVEVSIEDVTSLEADGTLQFPVSLSILSEQVISVDFTTVDGSATLLDEDYTSQSGSIQFEPGSSSRIVSVELVNDDIPELSETLKVKLSNPAPGSVQLKDDEGIGTITDHDGLPSIGISGNVTANEAEGTLSFTISLDSASSRTVEVDYSTAGGSASVAGGDYLAASGTLSFAPGDTIRSVPVSLVENTVHEATETMKLQLSNARNATIGTAEAEASITDDDLLEIKIGDVSGSEGLSSLDFEVSLSIESEQTIAVDYATANGTATVGGEDYNSQSGTLTFNPGEKGKTISVPLIENSINEASEAFKVQLSAGTLPSNVTIADDEGVGTIGDNDPVAISIGDVTAGEGDGSASFTISLDRLSDQTITVNYATGSATSGVVATAGTDYTAISAATLTFNPGDSSKKVPVSITGDSDSPVNEADEAFEMNLSDATIASISDATAIGTIADDDPVSIQIGDAGSDSSIVEGNELNFNVTLSIPSEQAISVDYATADGSAISSSELLEVPDYEAQSGTVTFKAGIVSQTIAVATNDDTISSLSDFELLYEDMFVNLTDNGSNASSVSIGDKEGKGIIKDNDTEAGL